MRYLAVYACYVGLAALGLAVHVNTSTSVTLVWAPSGFAVAVLLAWGRTYAWPILAASFTINAIVGEASLLAAGCICLGNTAEYLIAFEGVKRLWPLAPEDSVLSGLVAGLLIAVGCAVAASVGTGALALTGNLSDFGDAWIAWWAGDALGIFVFVVPSYLILAPLKRG